MKVIQLKEAGGVENFIYTEHAKPKVQQDEVLVKVKSISINPVDVKARSNDGVLSWIFNDIRPVILGWDISGEIIEIGESVKSFQIGDPVFGMANFIGSGNAYAEYVAVPANQLAIKPKGISHEEASGATLAVLTAWQALVTNGAITKGSKVLIHAGAGGVGHFAVQIAKHLGAYVIATSSAKNKDFILALGADQHIDYHSEKFDEKLSDVDFVLDTIGGEVLFHSVDVVKENGKIISLPSPNFDPRTIEKANERNVNLSFILVQSNGDDMKAIANLLDKGYLKTHISKRFSFAEMGKAHLQIATNRTVGKVVVTL